MLDIVIKSGKLGFWNKDVFFVVGFFAATVLGCSFVVSRLITAAMRYKAKGLKE